MKKNSTDMINISRRDLKLCCVIKLLCLLMGVRLHPAYAQERIGCLSDEAQVSLKLSQLGAAVWIDGALIGYAPLPPLCVTAGLHLIELKRLGSKRVNRSASQLVWTPRYGTWTVDLSDLSLKVEPSDVTSSHPQPQSPRSSNREAKRESDEGEPQRGEWADLGFRGGFWGVRTPQAPQHEAILSLHEIGIWVPERAFTLKGLSLKTHLLSRQDLLSGDLPLHRSPAWRARESELFTQEFTLGWRPSNGSWRLKLGRTSERFGQRDLLMDQASAEVSWGQLRGKRLMSPSIVAQPIKPDPLEKRWSLRLRSLIGRGAERPMIGVNDHNEISGGQSGPSPYQMAPYSPWRLALFASLEHINAKRALRLESGLLMNLMSSVREDTISDIQRPLWSLRGDGRLKSLFVEGALTVYADRFAGFSLDQMSEASLMLSRRDESVTHPRWGASAWGAWRAGDSWDQISIPSALWPQATLGSQLKAGASAHYRQLHVQLQSYRGAPPSWHTSASPAHGQVSKVEILWGGSSYLLDELQLFTQAPSMIFDARSRDAEELSGPILHLALWESEGSARRWGMNPWSEPNAIDEARRAAIGLGWRAQWSLERGRVTAEIRGYIDPLSVHRLKGMKTLSTQHLWGEAQLSYRSNALKTSAYCGQPLELPHLPTRNLWLVTCGVSITVNSRLTL